MIIDIRFATAPTDVILFMPASCAFVLANSGISST